MVYHFCRVRVSEGARGLGPGDGRKGTRCMYVFFGVTRHVDGCLGGPFGCILTLHRMADRILYRLVTKGRRQNVVHAGARGVVIVRVRKLRSLFVCERNAISVFYNCSAVAQNSAPRKIQPTIPKVASNPLALESIPMRHDHHFLRESPSFPSSRVARDLPLRVR